MWNPICDSINFVYATYNKEDEKKEEDNNDEEEAHE